MRIDLISALYLGVVVFISIPLAQSKLRNVLSFAVMQRLHGTASQCHILVLPISA